MSIKKLLDLFQILPSVLKFLNYDGQINFQVCTFIISPELKSTFMVNHNIRSVKGFILGFA